MRCISPIQLTRPVRTTVPCGRCNYCLQSKRADWSFRLIQEWKHADSAHFLTLTYEDARINLSPLGLPQLCKRDVQLFTKRLRKLQNGNTHSPIRYYTVGEYGTQTQRPHYHSIMFNVHDEVLSQLPNVWPQGHTHIGSVSEASIHYVTKYVINRVEDGATCPVMKRLKAREPPFSLMSRRPGIGAQYVDTHLTWHRTAMRNYTQVNGIKNRIPRYYKSKLFTDKERESMAPVSIADSDIAYHKEIARLKKFHSDPYYYYDECAHNGMVNVTSKINDTNLF